MSITSPRRDAAPGAAGRAVPPTLAAGTPGVHAADCSIWDTPPDAQPDALLAAGVRNEAVAAYLSDVHPLYEAAKRCLGQLSGLLLLLQTDGLDRNRDGLLLSSADRQLAEAGERLRAVRAPSAAHRHRAMLAGLLARLEQILSRLGRLRELADPAGPDLDAVVDALFAAQRDLHLVSIPKAGLAPVDFTSACCSCRRPAKNN